MSRLRSWLRAVGWVGLGLILGGGLGLYLGWTVWPTEFTNASPAALEESYRRDYALMTAAAYTADGNLAAAEKRVESLGENGRSFYFSFTLDSILRGGNEPEIRQLVRLAADLGFSSPAMTPYLAEPEPIP